VARFGEFVNNFTSCGLFRRPSLALRSTTNRREETLMTRNLVLPALGALLLTAFAVSLTAQDAKATRGQQVYADQKCSLCHSIGDKGNKKGPLDTTGSKLSPADLRAWIVDAKGMTAKTKATRKPEMKNYDLPKDDLDALVAYMATLKK
jgi:mono/diheme cytochrome c family protein